MSWCVPSMAVNTMLMCCLFTQVAYLVMFKTDMMWTRVSFCVLQGYFLKNRTNFDLEDKFLPVSNMASSGLKKMLDFIILYTLKSVSEKCLSCNFLDAKPILCHMMACDMLRQMLMPMGCGRC